MLFEIAAYEHICESIIVSRRGQLTMQLPLRHLGHMFVLDLHSIQLIRENLRHFRKISIDEFRFLGNAHEWQ